MSSLDVEYTLPPLPSELPGFGYGFEAGLLWSVLAGPVKSADEQMVYQVARANRIYIEVMAERTGWDVRFEVVAEDRDQLVASFARAKPRLALVRRPEPGA